MDVRMKNGNGTMVASVSIGFAGGVQSQKSCSVVHDGSDQK
jgi:hypothetical protein